MSDLKRFEQNYQNFQNLFKDRPDYFRENIDRFIEDTHKLNVMIESYIDATATFFDFWTDVATKVEGTRLDSNNILKELICKFICKIVVYPRLNRHAGDIEKARYYQFHFDSFRIRLEQIKAFTTT